MNPLSFFSKLFAENVAALSSPVQQVQDKGPKSKFDLMVIPFLSIYGNIRINSIKIFSQFSNVSIPIIIPIFPSFQQVFPLVLGFSGLGKIQTGRMYSNFVSFGTILGFHHFCVGGSCEKLWLASFSWNVQA